MQFSQRLSRGCASENRALLLRTAPSRLLPAVAARRRHNSRQDAGATFVASALLFANGRPQFVDNFLRRLDGGSVLVHVERDGADSGVAAAAVALADAGQVHPGFLWRPGVRSY